MLRLTGALISVAMMTLSACNAPQDDAFQGGPSFRDQSALIGVTSRFDPVRFEGAWQVRAYLPGDEQIRQVAISVGAGSPQMQLGSHECRGLGKCADFGGVFRLQREGKGRFVARMPDGLQRRIWVLWVDEGFRTAVLGNPAGTFAWILDRASTGGADRIRAGREILDFNGYDAGQLKVNK